MKIYQVYCDDYLIAEFHDRARLEEYWSFLKNHTSNIDDRTYKIVILGKGIMDSYIPSLH